jgi:single-strand DNA-binding protein
MLIGRLSQDPELRYTQRGQSVCRFNIATGRRYKDVNGEWKEETSFIPIVTWQNVAIRCNERLKKGSPVYIQGRLRSRSWEDKEGQRHYALEVYAREVQFLQVADKEATDDVVSATAATNEEPTIETVDNDKTEEEIPF